jgi:hypothetical protein
LFSLGQLGRISFLGQQVNVYLYEPVLLINLTFFLFQYKFEPVKKTLQSLKSLYILLGYLLISFIVLIPQFSVTQNEVGFLYFVRLTAYCFYFIYLFYHVKHSQIYKKDLDRGIIITAVLTSLSSVVQYFFYTNLRNISYLGWDPHEFRMVGLFFDPPVAGAIYGLLFVYLYFRLKRFSFIIKIVTLGLLVGCIFLTYSRGTYLALFITAIFLIFRNKIVYGLLVCALVAISAFFVLPKQAGESSNLMRTFTIVSRLSNYQEAVSLWEKNPVVGSGYNRIRYVKGSDDFSSQTDFETNHAGASFHSSFLIMLVAGGVIGLSLYIWFLYSLSKLNYVSAISMIFLSILSLTDNVLLHPFVLLMLFWVVVNPLYDS